jgi:hypothetical protein
VKRIGDEDDPRAEGISAPASRKGSRSPPRDRHLPEVVPPACEADVPDLDLVESQLASDLYGHDRALAPRSLWSY